MTTARVLYVIDTLKVGGAQQHLLDLVRSLDSSRFLPFVCTLGHETRLSEEARKSGATVLALGLDSILDRRAGRAMPRFVRWIRQQRIDLAHTYLSSSGVYGTLAARLAGVTRLITSRRDMGFSRSWRLAALEQLLINPIVQRVVAVSDAVADEACRELFLNPGKVVTIYNGAPLDRRSSPPVGSPSEARRRWGLPENTPVVTIVASLSPVKAHEVFIEAAARVLESGRSAEFVVVGDGPRREACARLVEELDIEAAVHFLGELSSEELAGVLGLSDIGVLTSDTEGMSNALLEFMVHAKPVVATRVGGNPEVVGDGSSGYLVPHRNPAALADALVGLLDEPERAIEMGRNGQRRVERLFSHERMVRSMELLYSRLLGLAETSDSSFTPTATPEREGQ